MLHNLCMNFHETKIHVFCAIFFFVGIFLYKKLIIERKSRNALASLNKTNFSSVLENQQAVAQGKLPKVVREPKDRLGLCCNAFTRGVDFLVQ